MTMTDPIADMLTRIRNAQQARHVQVSVPHSAMKCRIVQVLQDEGYVRGYAVQENDKGFKDILIDLKYVDGRAVIQKVKRVSKPGRRVYASISKLPLVASGLGINILSTSHGVMADSRARKMSLGGEVICTVF